MSVQSVEDRRTSRLERMEATAHAENGNGAKAKPRIGGRGTAGTQLLSGYLSPDEYVPELTWPRSITTYDKMRRSDGMVRATTRALTMPLLSAMWTIKPASEDQADAKMATFIEDGLFEGMTMTWKRTLREALTSLPFGHSVAEKWWEIRDDEDGRPRVMPRKLLPIKQRTISAFNVEEDGGLKSVQQQQFRDGRYLTEDLPIKDLLVFVNEQEGADWLGQSVLRPAYKHWWIADQLARIQAIAAERHGVGIPYVELQDGDDDVETIGRWEDILANIRVNERGYIVVTGGAKFGIAGMGEGRALDVLPMIQHHNRMTAVSVLAQFLTLGATDVGSWALSADQSGLFLMALQSIGDEIAAVFNDYMIKPWIDYNFTGVRKYPQLTVTNIETRNGDKLLTAVADAIQKGAIKYDRDLENALRDGLNLPAAPEEDEEEDEPAEVPPAGGPGAPGAPEAPGTPVTPQPAAPFRVNTQPTEYLEETERIRERAKEIEGKAHAFEAAEWTHPNGHPRCRLCGREEPISGRCDGETLWHLRSRRWHDERDHTTSLATLQAGPDIADGIAQALVPVLAEMRADRAELVEALTRRTRTVREKHFELGELNGQIVVTGATESEREEPIE